MGAYSCFLIGFLAAAFIGFAQSIKIVCTLEYWNFSGIYGYDRWPMISCVGIILIYCEAAICLYLQNT